MIQQSLNIARVTKAIAAGGKSADVLREVILSSMLSTRKMSLVDLLKLDQDNLKIAFSVMLYRTQPGWSQKVCDELLTIARA